MCTLEPPQVKYEPAAPVGDKASEGLDAETLFPHLYGTIDFGSVVQELPVTRAADGSFLSIQGL